MKQLFCRGQCNRTAGPSVLAGVKQQLTDFPGSWNTHTGGGTSYHHLRLICVMWCASSLLILVGSDTAFWHLWSTQNGKDERICAFIHNLLRCKLMYVYFCQWKLMYGGNTNNFRNEVFPLLGYYTLLIGSRLSTFWNSILDPFLDSLTLVRCPKMSAIKYQ